MNWKARIRQAHRWVSVAFTLTVIANFTALAMESAMPPARVTSAPLLPLGLLTLTGLSLFPLPYATKARRERRAEVERSHAR
ncbi:MAG: hypothetical protein IPJ41_15630 [Phycisphaerales bacterium]|nr:hypothetical protein [Phycisphaerales bacterium]